MTIWSRRHFILSGASLPLLTGCKTTPEISLVEAHDLVAALEMRSGGRIGVSARHLGSGRAISHRSEERFAMCSSFKWLLGYFMAVRDHRGEDDLGRILTYTRDDLISWSPVTELAVDGPGLTIRDLCKATIQTSDNTAANLLLRELGGPDGLTRLIRETGDQVTRLDRWEPALNENAPGDPRDTTTPEAMTALMARLLFGEETARNHIAEVREWMMGTTTGDARLRAGISKGWIVGNKTGTSSNNQSNDVGFALTFPTNYTAQKGPVVITSFLNVSSPMAPETDLIHADIARISMQALTV